jgi:L,D-transpeptidase ErfK/SrfK
MRVHTVAPRETLLDISRHYSLGFNEIQILHPHVDPWIPEPGLCLSIPTHWILPRTRYQGVVINLPELRLYRFFSRIEMVKTYPIGIGDAGYETPKGVYRVVEREVDPTWDLPPSLRKHFGVTKVPPGPENPLGKYWIGLSRKGYGIHGTAFPWGVGRLVSHGCIRLYPEHIAQLFEEVSIGTPVEIIYEPVKIGFKGKQVFLEVHPDVYRKIADIKKHTRRRLQALGLWNHICVERMEAVLQRQNGVPVCIGTIQKGGEKTVAQKPIDAFGQANALHDWGRRRFNESTKR